MDSNRSGYKYFLSKSVEVLWLGVAIGDKLEVHGVTVGGKSVLYSADMFYILLYSWMIPSCQ